MKRGHSDGPAQGGLSSVDGPSVPFGGGDEILAPRMPVLSQPCCRGTSAFPMKIRVSVLALWAFALASTSTAHAEESRTSSDDPPVLTVRAGLPFTGLIGSERVGAIKLGGLSASLRLLDLVEAEVGVPFWINACESGPSYGGRVGISPSLVALPAARTGWNIRLPVLVGYDFFVFTGGGCEYHTDSRMHVVTGATGLDFSYFWSSSIGVNFRALGFAGNSWYRSLSSIKGQPFSSPELTDSMMLWGATFDAGISIRFE